MRRRVPFLLLAALLAVGCTAGVPPALVQPPAPLTTALPPPPSAPPPTSAATLPPPRTATAVTLPPPPPTASSTPTPGATAPPATPAPALPATPTRRAGSTGYVVRAGDGLIALGQRFGVTPEAILAANGLTLGEAMQPGRALIIPPQQPRPTATRGPFVVAPTAVPPGVTAREIGRSVYGLPLHAYTLGQGARQVVLVGGLHGGFEGNTILLAYGLLDYFAARPELLPPAVTLHVIPAANPDGLYKGSGQVGRFAPGDLYSARYDGRTNGRDVDLNRNWDCDWRADATWRNETVSGGSAPYSEPETAALRDYLLPLDPAVVLFWHSAADAIYLSGCEEPDLQAAALAETYAAASGYPIFDGFSYYEVTGDASNALAAQGIPAFTVELSTLDDLDWAQNLAGVTALLAAVAQGE